MHGGHPVTGRRFGVGTALRPHDNRKNVLTHRFLFGIDGVGGSSATAPRPVLGSALAHEHDPDSGEK